MSRLIHADLSESIIGAGFEVLNAIKPGQDEKIYENALVLELELRGHRVDQQKSYKVQYKGATVGRLVPDLIVDEKVLIDTKVVKQFNENHEAQMIGYLAITGLQLAILLNFKHKRLQWKRIVR